MDELYEDIRKVIWCAVSDYMSEDNTIRIGQNDAEYNKVEGIEILDFDQSVAKELLKKNKVNVSVEGRMTIMEKSQQSNSYGTTHLVFFTNVELYIEKDEDDENKIFYNQIDDITFSRMQNRYF